MTSFLVNLSALVFMFNSVAYTQTFSCYEAYSCVGDDINGSNVESYGYKANYGRESSIQTDNNLYIAGMSFYFISLFL